METPSPELVSHVRDHLNKHGHAFHYSVLAEVQRLQTIDVSHWTFQVSEFPVEVQGSALHIDFILKRGGGNAYLIAECKRPNPALNDWCFVRAPYVRRNAIDLTEIVVEEVAKVGSLSDLSANPCQWGHLSQIFHLAFEIKGSATGETKGSGRGALDDAITQVFRGVNGVVEMLAKHHEFVKKDEPWTLIPVIFTTARLWTVNIDLSTAALQTGTLETLPELQAVQWLGLNYAVSPKLRHTEYRTFNSAGLSELLANEHLRTVFFVSSSGVEEFLRWSSDGPY